MKISFSKLPVIRCQHRCSTAAVDNLVLLDQCIFPGSRHTIGKKLPNNAPHQTSIVIVHGTRPGPTLCLTAGLHGDELNGVEITRQTMQSLDPGDLRGTVIGIPVVNIAGYLQGTRLMEDQLDINRCFPGAPGGSFSAQVAHTIFSEIIMHCDALIDLHTGGSSRRENLPQLRADLSSNGVAELVKGFPALSIVHERAPQGSLRRAATDAGIPAVAAEIGGSQGLEPEKVAIGVQGLQSLLFFAKMTSKKPAKTQHQHHYQSSNWIRAEYGGILVNKVMLGAIVQEGDLIAEIIDPLTSIVHRIIAPLECTILGRVPNQVVSAGYDLFRVGIAG